MMCISWARALLVMVSSVGICTNALSLEAALGNFQKDLDAFAAKIDEGKPSSLKIAELGIVKLQELAKTSGEDIANIKGLLEVVLRGIAESNPSDFANVPEFLQELTSRHAFTYIEDALNKVMGQSNAASVKKWDEFFELMATTWAAIEKPKIKNVPPKVVETPVVIIKKPQVPDVPEVVESLARQDQDILGILEMMLSSFQEIDADQAIKAHLLVSAYPTKDALFWKFMHVSSDLKEKMENPLKNNFTDFSKKIQELSKKVNTLGDKIWTTRIEPSVKK